MPTPKPSSKVSQHPTKSPVPIPKMRPNTQQRRIWDPKEHDAQGWFPADKAQQVTGGGR
jgi:hypothetical protein